MKNHNRQFAATHRKRTAEGKFKDSVHRSRFERRFARQAIFLVTRIKKPRTQTQTNRHAQVRTDSETQGKTASDLRDEQNDFDYLLGQSQLF